MSRVEKPLQENPEDEHVPLSGFRNYEEAAAWIQGERQAMMSDREVPAPQDQESADRIRFAEAQIRGILENYRSEQPIKYTDFSVSYHKAFDVPSNAPQDVADSIRSYKAGMKSAREDMAYYKTLKTGIEEGSHPWAEELNVALKNLDEKKVVEIETRIADLKSCLMKHISSLETGIRLAEDQAYWESEIAPGATRLKRYEELSAFLKADHQPGSAEDEKTLFIQKAEALREQHALAESGVPIGGLHQKVYLHLHPETPSSKEFAPQ